MSRWSTPKSYCKQRRDAYLNLDDENHHVDGNQFFRAPRKVKPKTLHHTYTIHTTDNNPIDSYSRSNYTFDSSQPKCDAVVSRDSLDYYINQTHVSNRNTKQKCPYSFADMHSLNVSSYPHMNDSTIATRPCIQKNLPKPKSSEDYHVHRAFEEPITIRHSPIDNSNVSNEAESGGEEERRDEVEKARFGIFEERDREENFPYDEHCRNHHTYARKSIRAHVSSRAPSILPLKPIRTPLRAAKVARFSAPKPVSKNRKSDRSSLKHHDSQESSFGSFHTNAGLSSPPRVSRHSSTKGIFDLTPQPYPTQRRQIQKRSKPKQEKKTLILLHHRIVGPACLGIHRLRLPNQYLKYLNQSELPYLCK